MKYLCQVWFDSALFEAMSPEEKASLDRDSFAYDQDLVARGHMITAEALQSPRSAVTVTVRNGETSMTDGPFAETKEQLGGFILIDAKDHERRDPRCRGHSACQARDDRGAADLFLQRRRVRRRR